MSEEQKPTRIVFAPGCLEQLEEDLDLDELQGLMDHLAKALEDGTLFSESTLVDMDELKESDPELYLKLSSQLENITDGDIIPPTLN